MDLIANKILRHPLMKSLNYEDIIDHTVSVLKLIKAPGIYKEEPCFRRIENHKVAIPKEALNLKKVQFVDGSGSLTPMIVSSNSLAKQFAHIDTRTAFGKSIQNSLDLHPEIYSDPSVSNITKHNTIQSSQEPVINQFKYSVNSGHIICSMRDGNVMLVYDTINSDEDGVPLIPNSEALIKAITNYIKIQVFEVLVDLNKISERSLTRAEQDYSWYVGQAQTEFQGIGSEDEMESFLNAHVNLFNSSTLHSDNYESSSDKEIINIL